jgi:hypothetical protein
MKVAGLSVSGAVLALLAAGGAAAATFGPATGAIAVLGSPSVMVGPTNGDENFNSAIAIFATTGSLTQANGSGTVQGMLNFSDTVGATVLDAVNDFMTFADTTGGDFKFNVSSVETLSYTNIPGVSTSITLYLLGTAGDAHLGLAPSPTSETITVNSTGGSAYSASATIASPPSMGAPEPAAWAMMLVGFGLMGTALRARPRMRTTLT